jgi:inosose dehydratase
MDEALRSIHQAGYRRVELVSDFLKPELRAKTFHLLAQYALAAETVYTGTTLHEANAAQKSIGEVMELARALKPLRTRAIVTNPSPKPKQARKSDDELKTQAHFLNQLGKELRSQGIKLLIHHHTPELVDGAREWWYMVEHTDPALVSCCVDVHWAFRGGQDVMPFLRRVGNRLASMHLRNSQHGVWMEDLGPGDVDYSQVAAYLHQIKYEGYLVIELAYEKDTHITRSLEEDLRLSRLYTEKVFGLRAS